jgi:hypothetical protein
MANSNSTQNADQKPENFRRVYEEKINSLSQRNDEQDQALAEKDALIQRLQNQNAFRDAGLDTSDKLNEMFMNAYQGDMSVEAIQAEANSLGLLDRQTSVSVQPPEQYQDFMGDEAQQRIVAAGQGGDPIAMKTLSDAMDNATNAAELQAVWEAAGNIWNGAV